MVIPDSLKLNRFQHVAIPENSTFFSRFEGVRPSEAHFSGDDGTPELQSKVDAIVNGMRIAKEEEQ